jgi:hypothetical protein
MAGKMILWPENDFVTENRDHVLSLGLEPSKPETKRQEARCFLTITLGSVNCMHAKRTTSENFAFSCKMTRILSSTGKYRRCFFLGSGKLLTSYRYVAKTMFVTDDELFFQVMLILF